MELNNRYRKNYSPSTIPGYTAAKSVETLISRHAGIHSIVVLQSSPPLAGVPGGFLFFCFMTLCSRNFFG
jgi:hypothetical protein